MRVHAHVRFAICRVVEFRYKVHNHAVFKNLDVDNGTAMWFVNDAWVITAAEEVGEAEFGVFVQSP